MWSKFNDPLLVLKTPVQRPPIQNIEQSSPEEDTDYNTFREKQKN